MKKILLLAFLVFVPQITNASVYISEVMYDLDGTDSDREWVEIHNDTDQDIDLSSYYLYENETAHKITPASAERYSVAKGDFAVIVDSVDKFNEDWPNFNGIIFDSTFGLNNSGEEISLLNSLKETVDNLTYNPDLGANGTGNTLQFYDGVWMPGAPTPGEENITEPADESEPEDSSDTVDNSSDVDESVHSEQNDLSNFVPKIKVKTGIGRDRIVPVNTQIDFEVYSSEDEKGRNFWNFGDGEKGTGNKVNHVYRHPGEYNIVLNSVFKENKNTSRAKVVVIEPEIKIIEHENSIELNNVGNKELNIGGFILKVDKKEIKIIKDTIISKGHSIFFDVEPGYKKVFLKYSNGKQLYSNSIEKAEKFCEKAIGLGLKCDVSKMANIFDRI